jgi:hypothetical protein
MYKKGRRQGWERRSSGAPDAYRSHLRPLSARFDSFGGHLPCLAAGARDGIYARAARYVPLSTSQSDSSRTVGCSRRVYYIRLRQRLKESTGL